MKLAVAFTNFGPYHLARLRALGDSLARDGGALIAHEMAGSEKKYPWETDRAADHFRRSTLFPDCAIEEVPPAACAEAMREALERDRPDAVAVCGYSRPESMAALGWAEAHRKPAILMSESGAMDRPRSWWKEAIKARRVRRFSSALVGGPRHRDYLARLGMPPGRIALGYNAVDNAGFSARAEQARRSGPGRSGLPEAPYFLAVSRFVPEKNLLRLIRGFASYKVAAGPGAWDLVLCGSGPDAAEVETAARSSGVEAAIHRPGFLRGRDLARLYAFAGAFVLPSLSEPWGLVVNEAAACGLPLLISDRAGCVETLVPDPPGTTGFRFPPAEEAELANALAGVAGLPESHRRAMGAAASRVVSDWGPDRFALGMRQALDLARLARRPRSHPPTAARKP